MALFIILHQHTLLYVRCIRSIHTRVLYTSTLMYKLPYKSRQ